jgi:hypothetical protein
MKGPLCLRMFCRGRGGRREGHHASCKIANFAQRRGREREKDKEKEKEKEKEIERESERARECLLHCKGAAGCLQF